MSLENPQPEELGYSIQGLAYWTTEKAVNIALMHQSHPTDTFYLPRLVDPDLDDIEVVYVQFRSPRCPSCGLYEGTDSHGAPSKARDGGAEHVCWRCAKLLEKVERGHKFFGSIRKVTKLVTVYHQDGDAYPLLVPSSRVSEFHAAGWFPAEALDDDGEGFICGELHTPFVYGEE